MTHVGKHIFLSTLASLSLIAVAKPANAVSGITSNPGLNSGNCSYASAAVVVDGDALQITGDAWGLGYADGACNGAPAAENTVAFEPTLSVLPLLASEPHTCMWGGWSGFEYNTEDVWGIYVATIPGATESATGNVGTVFPASQLCGPGYYQLEIVTYIYTEGGWQPGIPLTTPWTFADLSAP
jgi:hypothetical protein